MDRKKSSLRFIPSSDFIIGVNCKRDSISRRILFDDTIVHTTRGIQFHLFVIFYAHREIQLHLFVIYHSPRGIQLHLFVIFHTHMVIQLHLSVIVHTQRVIQLHLFVIIHTQGNTASFFLLSSIHIG